MLGVLPFVEDPNFSWSAAPALPQHLPPWLQITTHIIKNTKLCVVFSFYSVAVVLRNCSQYSLEREIDERGCAKYWCASSSRILSWDHVGCWLTGGSHALARRPPPSISMQYTSNMEILGSNYVLQHTRSNNILQQYTTVKCFGSPFSSKYFAEILFQVFQWNKPPSTQIQQHTTSKYSASILQSSVEYAGV